jgi:methylmalonyl-CoA mutase
MDDPDLSRALAQLVDDLANGATGVCAVLQGGDSAFGLGLDGGAARLSDRLAAAVAGKQVALRLDGAPPGLAKSLAKALSGTAAPAALHFGLDRVGMGSIATAEDFLNLTEAAGAGTVLNADGRVLHNAGGTEAQELAVMAAALSAHLKALDAVGVAPDAVLRATSLCLVADQDQFLTIAKARAARLIFARMADACGVDRPVAAHLFMQTSYRMLTRLDPESNLLRNTIAVFAAGTGGADEISVLPHTVVHGIPDALARRLARNCQTVLIAESHLDHVLDPSAGAGGIEAVTDALAERAWEIFTDIERGGGLAAAHTGGRLAALVVDARKSRQARPIVGTSLFVMKHERPVNVLGPLLPLSGELMPARLDEEDRG